MDEACQWKSFLTSSLRTEADQQSWKPIAPQPVPRGRWMLRICTIGSVTGLGELGIHVSGLKQALRAVLEAAVGATACKWLRRAHSDWGTKTLELDLKEYTCFSGTMYEEYFYCVYLFVYLICSSCIFTMSIKHSLLDFYD